jgi:hypothetical protein
MCKCCKVAANIALDVLKLEGKGIKAVKQVLVSIATAKKNTLKGKDVLDNLRSSKTEEYHNNNIDNTKDNQEGFTLDSECNKDYNRKFLIFNQFLVE